MFRTDRIERRGGRGRRMEDNRGTVEGKRERERALNRCSWEEDGNRKKERAARVDADRQGG